jgi:hypothetical protein
LLRLREDAVVERENLAGHVLEVIEVHAGDDFLESPVKFGWVRVTTCHAQNGNRTSQAQSETTILRGLNNSAVTLGESAG